MKTWELIHKVGVADGHAIHTGGSREYPYLHGCVRTSRGYVRVYSEPTFTQVSIIQDGYEISRSFTRSYTKRGLVTLARRFIEEVHP